MQTNILWSGIEYYSLENCIVNFDHDDIVATSRIVGYYEGKIYSVEYLFKLNKIWQTYYCLVEIQVDNEFKSFELIHNQNKWNVNGKPYPEFDQCIDIDIPLTPFTNTLPINRLSLKPDEEKEVDVIYIDLLRDSIKHVKQKYRRVSDEIYKYENIPNDFEAEIIVDQAGFVKEYPQLFTRTAKIQSNP